jgi:hypothetical protein
MEDIDFGNIFTIELFDSVFDIDLGSCHIYHSSIYSLELSISTFVSNDESFDDGIEGVHIWIVRVWEAGVLD